MTSAVAQTILSNSYSNIPEAYTQPRQKLWDQTAIEIDRDHLIGKHYHRRLKEIYRSLIPPQSKVLEIGCGKGDLLASLNPCTGVGVDFSVQMISQAHMRHPELTFCMADAHNFEVEGIFDFVIISDLINDLWDVQTFLTHVRRFCHPGTRIILNTYSRLWQPVLQTAQVLKLAVPQLQQNWFTVQDIQNLLYVSGFEVLRKWQECLLPLPIPLINQLFNKILVKLWPFNLFGLANFIIARPFSGNVNRISDPSVSVIVPARNEAGNIANIFERVPEMGAGTELIFVEGHSNDYTYQTIENCMLKYPQRRCKLFRQDSIGKGDAVRKGFQNASGDILMILDADLTVVPEDLPRFFEAIVMQKGEFINGVRLVYPMEKQAMRFINFLGNKFFSLAFSWLLGQSVKDTLCGTKVLWKTDYEILAANRSYFGDFDPFGDYDLLFGAARLNLKLVDMPIRYRERVYGTTNIQRWRHSILLLRMTAFAASRLKFI